MAVLNKFNLVGEKVGEFTIDDSLLESSVNSQLIKDYIIALRANARQWSANTKSRPEVSHSGQKPHPQKGTGKARQGYLGATQYKGGGRVHAPKPKFDQHVRINRKERQAAVRHLLVERILDNSVMVLDSKTLNEPKTKVLSSFLKKVGFDDKKVMFLGDTTYTPSNDQDFMVTPFEKHSNIVLSLRNLPKTSFRYVPNVNGYELLVNKNLVILDTAVDELLMLLGGRK